MLFLPLVDVFIASTAMLLIAIYKLKMHSVGMD
jgi:hypothetical protein